MVKSANEKPKNFRDFLKLADSISQRYFQHLFGEDNQHDILQRRVFCDLPKAPLFFSIYHDTEYAAGEHWEFLTDFLGFYFDDLMFSFSESDCGNPSIMAHIRGLKVERLYGRSYANGVGEYAEFGLNIMRQKDFPEHLIECMAERFKTDSHIEKFRVDIDLFTQDSFAISEQNLVCLVHSPFTDGGKRLHTYLNSEAPGLLRHERDIHRLLGNTASNANTGLAEQLQQLSGLELIHLRACYNKPLTPSLLEPSSEGNVLSAILKRDPHKRIIVTQKSPGAPDVPEMISGR